MSSSKLGRARRVLGVLGSVVGVTVTFVAGVTSAVVIHLDNPTMRRLVVTQANAILKSTLRGEVHVDRIGHIGLDGASGMKVRVKDPEGVQVLDVTGVRADANALAIARSALFESGPIVVRSSLVRVDDVDANLDTDGTNDQNLRLANAFMPRDTTPSDPNAPPGRGVRVEAPKVQVGHAWAHGYPPGGQPVDADLHGLAGRFHMDPWRLDAVLERVALDARAVPRGLDPKGIVNGKLSMPMEGDRPPMAIEGSFDGKAANIPLVAKMTMTGDRLDAVVDAHDATGSDAGLVVTEVTIRDELRLHAEVHGDLPHLDARANVVLGKATVDATAAIDTGPTTRIKGQASVRDVDASALQKGAPKTVFGLDATADVTLEEAGPRGTASVDTLPGLIANQRLPKIEIRAEVAGKTGHARIVIPDPQLKTKVEIDLEPHGADGQTIAAVVESRIPDLHRVPYVGTMFGGSASLDASGTLTLPEKTIAAKSRLSVTRVRDHELSLGVARSETTVSGTLDRPVIDTHVEARDLFTGTLPLAKLDAGAHIVIENGAVEITGLGAEAVRPLSEPIIATAKLVKIDGSLVRVDGAVVSGVGEPVHVDVVKNGNDIDGTIDAPGIDLRLLSRIAGQERALGIETGTLSIGAKGGFRHGDVKADLHAELRDFSSRDVHGANAKVDAAVDGRMVALDARASVGDAGELTLKTDRIVLGGQASDPNAWKKAFGKIDLDASVDLARLERLIPPEAMPVSDLHGSLVVRARAGRDSADAPPEIQMHAHTRDLAVAGKAEAEPSVDGIEVRGVAPWRSVGVDLGVDVRNDATSGLTNVAFRATDAHGVLVAFDSKTILPYDELVKNPSAAKDKAVAAPISVRMVIPPRRLEELPALAGTKETAGIFEADLEASGTVLEPHVRFIAKGRGLRAVSMPKDTKADTDIALDYDGERAKLAIKSAARGQDLLTVTASANIRSRDFIVGTPSGAPPEWTASAQAHLASFPLETVPQLAAQRIKGRISGDFTLDDLHHAAKATGHLALEKFKVGRVEYEKGNIDIEAGRGKLAAKVRIEQKDGYIDASATSGLSWGAELAPSLDEQQVLEAKLEAKSFRAAAIQPFVATALPTLDGRIDADAHATVSPGRPGAALEGKVVFSDGTILPAALGEELRKVRATVTLAKDGTIKLEDASASGISGEVHAKGNAKIDGMRLADATVDIDIPKEKAFDFAVQGQPLGEMYGTIKVKASQSIDGKITKIGVEIPSLDVELPQTTKTGVATLDKKENVRVGVYREPDVFVKLPLDKQDTLPPPEKREKDEGSRLDVDVKLGRVQIERGNQARVGLAGNLKVSVGVDTRITGEIHALDGWADVQGKKFTVERATVTFDGKPEVNPVVLATATWTAVDGTKVYADFVGPVKTGKVVLRSEPSRPRNEILALVLFGTADGANPTPSSGSASQKDSTTKTAVGVGGGIAAQGLTDALDDMAGIQATVRIDSTSSTNPRPEVEFQVSPRVAVAFGHVLGQPPITEPDTNLAKLNYRFHRNWSWETTVGDKGKAQTDAVWQKRY
ncbi:MAG: translocation/assembly module TamB domain-containing protein [Labilithrix sp.]